MCRNSKWRNVTFHGVVSHGSVTTLGQLVGSQRGDANAPKKQKAAVAVTRGATWKQTVNNSRHSISQMLGRDLQLLVRPFIRASVNMASDVSS